MARHEYPPPGPRLTPDRRRCAAADRHDPPNVRRRTAWLRLDYRTPGHCRTSLGAAKTSGGRLRSGHARRASGESRHCLQPADRRRRAASTGAALVDVHTMEAQAYATGGIPITSTCCFVTYGGGFYGLDGVHPSNTFYAILANSFIGTIDRAFGKSIPSFSPSDLAAIASSDPFAPK